MSEKENTPEKKKRPFRDDCMECEQQFDISNKKDFAVTYEVDDFCNHLYLNCPHCGEQYRVLVNNDTLNIARERGLRFNPEVNVLNPQTGEVKPQKTGGKYAPPEIIAMWQRTMGMEMVQPVEISPRHEKIIESFGKTICEMTVQDPDGFWSDMNSPQDRPHPTRWI